MFAMMMIIMGASAFVEIQFVRASGAFRAVMHNGVGPIPAMWCNLIFSVGLSVFLGHLFGAEGLIAFGGGIASTFVTAMYYPQMDRIEAVWTKRTEIGVKVHHVAMVTWKSVVLFWSIFTAPVRFAMAVTAKAKAGWRSVVAFYYALPFTNRKATVS